MGKIEELEEYVESLNPVDTWGWSVKRDRVWADKSSLLYFVGEIKQQLKSSLPTQQIDGIKELIRKIDEEMFAYPEIEPEQDDEATEDFKDGYNQASEVIIGYLKELPPQQDKVVVPELIHKWIKHVKGLKWGLADLLNPSVSNSYLARDAKEWLKKDKIHAEILARAWLEDDYTVEKEPLYWIYDPIADQYLGYDRAEEKVWWLLKQNDGARAELTDTEITKVGEQYRAFAVPVEEEGSQ